MPADRAGRRPRPGHDVAAGGGAVRVGEPLAHQAVRAELSIDGRRLSYLDFGGTGRPLVALHSHLPEGATFARLAPALSPEWRPIAPDQRGHGESDSAADYSREGYVADVLALLDHLGPARGVLFGRSLGAVNACRFTARHPERAALRGTHPRRAPRGLRPGCAVLLRPAGCGRTPTAVGDCPSTHRRCTTPRTGCTATTGPTGRRPPARPCWSTAPRGHPGRTGRRHGRAPARHRVGRARRRPPCLYGCTRRVRCRLTVLPRHPLSAYRRHGPVTANVVPGV
ncbi:alpha/beta fold hydrolase [Streptomyces fulvoviolaceus]|uniref:alpha/beta fold hydrolase n=1 Tax=Streptomyces fulvoviolaceus TaxID=285535 RepID=UPI001F461116|nr:alpha/beta hydrolase [Streptomyces fulvoviolaceus]